MEKQKYQTVYMMFSQNFHFSYAEINIFKSHKIAFGARKYGRKPDGKTHGKVMPEKW